MLKYGVPISLATMLTAFQAQFYAFLLPIYYVKDNTMIGNYGIATSFAVLIAFFATPITTMLFPAFSKLDSQKDQETLKNVFQSSVKYATLLVVPIAAMVMCLSEPAITTIFGSTYATAPLFLVLLSLTYVYTAFGSLSVANLINSQGKTKTNLCFVLLTTAIGFPLGYILIMQLGVIGLLLVTLVASTPSLCISVLWVKKHYKLAVDWRASAKIIFASASTAALTFLLVSGLSLPSYIRLLIGMFFFVFVFVPITLFTRTINQTDMDNLRTMTIGFGPLSRIINRFLNLTEKLMKTLDITKVLAPAKPKSRATSDQT